MASKDWRPSRPGSRSSSGGGIKNFVNAQKQKKEDAENERVQGIINEIAENEAKMINKLSSINFVRSALPKKILEAKKDPNQPFCDLECSVQAMIQTLQSNPQAVQIDIRKIDDKLLKLIDMFQEAVSKGNTRAAYAARAGLYRGVYEIRSKIPQDRPELSELFVKTHTRYLDSWITAVNQAYEADQLEKNVEQRRNSLAAAEKKNQERVDQFRAELTSTDPDKLALQNAYMTVMNTHDVEERDNWTKLEKDVHKRLVDLRMSNVETKLSETMMKGGENKLSAALTRLHVLEEKLRTVEIITDPNLLNKYQEEIDDISRILAEADAALDETLKSMDELEGRLRQLDIAPGAQRAQNVAQEQAEELLRKLQDEQEVQVNVGQKLKSMREKFGLLSEEELEQKRLEMEQQMVAEPLVQQQVVQNVQQNTQQLYID